MGILDLYKKLTTDPDKSAEERVEKLQERAGVNFSQTKKRIDKGLPTDKEIEEHPLFEDSIFIRLSKYLEQTKIYYIRLMEKFRHEPQERVAIAEDWVRFLEKVDAFCYNQSTINVGANDKHVEEAFRERDRLMLEIEEIQKRFYKLLED